MANVEIIAPKLKKLAEQYKSLGDETRLKILSMLAKGELCVCELIQALEMTQSAVSHHLKILKNAGLVEDRRDGKWIFYRLDEQNIRDLGEKFTQEFIYPISQRDKAESSPRDVSSLCETVMQKGQKPRSC